MRLPAIEGESRDPVIDSTIGILLLCAAELLYKPHLYGTQDLDAMANIIAIFIPIYEIDSLAEPHMLFLRFYIFLTICIPRLPTNLRTFDVYAEFEKVFPFPLKRYYLLVFIVMIHGLMDRSPKAHSEPLGGSFGRRWFSSLNLTDQQLNELFASVSFTLGDLPDLKKPAGYADFEFLRDHPYFNYQDELYCLDYEYAVAKLESAVLWRVRNNLPDKRRGAYFSFWGEVFEEYIAWLFEQYADKQLNQFYRAPKYQEDTPLPVCDAIVVCGSTAILIETKLATCAANVRYSGDHHKIKKFLEDRLVTGTDRPVGVSQLLRAIRKVTSMKAASLPTCLRGIKRLIPLIITKDDIGSSWMTNCYLNARFQSDLNRKACKPFIVTPLVSMSVGTLERGLAALGQMSLSDILQQRMRDDGQLSRPFEAASHYISRNTRHTGKHMELMDELIAEMTREFEMVDDNAVPSV